MIAIILMVLAVIFMVVKETLQINGKIVFYHKFVSCVGTERSIVSRVGSRKDFIEKQEEWRRKLSALHIYKEENEEGGRISIIFPHQDIAEIMFNEWEPRVHEQKYVLTNRENPQGVDDNRRYAEI
jgi:hypothetical protein